MSARVLVVDDLPPNVKLLEAKLSAEYFDVVTACDGPSAIKAAQTKSPDVILLDVMMPGMDGFEVCRHLKTDPATMHIPVIMVTALSEISDRVHGLESGADDFLTKPVNDVALFARIKSLARLKLIRDEWRRREETCDQFGLMPRSPVPLDEDAAHGRILLVEKSEALCRRIASIMDTDNAEIVCAGDPEQAMNMAKEGNFDLFVVGAIPGEAGGDALRLCSQLRAGVEARYIPVLLLVEEDEMRMLVKALELGINDYVVKPIDTNEFIARSRTQIRWKRYQERLRSNYERSLSLALTDSLTSLYNHRYVNVHLDTMLQRLAEGGKPVGVLMVDIDNFKAINDEYGHGAGDEVLRLMADRLMNSVRSFDTVARLGGEEFLVVLADANAEIVSGVAERLRGATAEMPFPIMSAGRAIRVTVSVGAAIAIEAGETAAALLKRADEALYQAKRQGKDRVVADFSAPQGRAPRSVFY
ncbi:MAG TPA: PleD family two-component system response regulator [Alphaproteobacteria bacterium]|nr:PleD family two-component system response regulator [Alphaproteobacteria bacterium]